MIHRLKFLSDMMKIDISRDSDIALPHPSGSSQGHMHLHFEITNLQCLTDLSMVMWVTEQS